MVTRTIKSGIILGVALFFTNTASAASLFFAPTTGAYGVGNEIAVDIKIDSEGVGLNASQATIRFPKDILEVKSVDKAGSTFNFWLEEPTFSNTDGVISFIGGTPYGVSGASLQVAHIVFTTKGSGGAPLTITDAAVTASDGTGTNILSKTKDAVFTVSPTTVTPNPAIPSVVAPNTIVPVPVQIVRKPAPASGLPKSPAVTIALYPDSTSWYNVANIFSAEWKLPADITGIKTAISKNPNFIPSGASEGLFDSKSFSALTDGVWYLHVRFSNSIGWGETAHYRIAVDTQPPLPFEITSGGANTATEDPNITLNFKGNDVTSGISKYQITNGSGEQATILAKDFNGSFKDHDTIQGKHSIVVTAFDLAGNGRESTIDHEVIPLASPTFTFVPAKIFSDDATGLTFKGTALPSTEILLSLKQGTSLVKSVTVSVDEKGNWEYTFADPLRNGTYMASIQNTDTRGAQSLVVDSSKVSITGKYTNLIVGSIIVLVGAIVAGVWFYERRRERTALRIDVAESDTTKVFNMIGHDIEMVEKARDTSTPADDEFAVKKMKDDVAKMSGYVKGEIKKAKD